MGAVLETEAVDYNDLFKLILERGPVEYRVLCWRRRLWTTWVMFWRRKWLIVKFRLGKEPVEYPALRWKRRLFSTWVMCWRRRLLSRVIRSSSYWGGSLWRISFCVGDEGCGVPGCCVGDGGC
eukprot:9503734-Pyramimonas_sp.AAC.1